MPQEISHEKTSLRIDRAKVAEAQQVLGTETIVETVDAALRAVIDLARRRRVMDRVRRDGGVGLRPSELRRLRRR